MAPRKLRWVVFGGGGFVGRHLAAELLRSATAEEIVLCDLQFPDGSEWPEAVLQAAKAGLVRTLRLDLRQPLNNPALPRNVDVVVNLAAVHREPGHAAVEYFETNVGGARHLVDWLESVEARTLIFTSSISVYGSPPHRVDEGSTPAPNTPYGISKLLAETIYEGWQRSGRDRTLIVLRPGVLYGPWENGNVSRLVRAVRKGYFFFCGNRHVHKSGGYVDEMNACLLWLLRQPQLAGRASVFNFSLPDVPTLAAYVAAIRNAGGVKRPVWSLPYPLLYWLAVFVAAVSSTMRLPASIHPRRVEKLRLENYIEPRRLLEIGYPYRYTLESSLQHWRNRPEGQEWR